MTHHYFVTGTDTDAGKTLVAAALLKLARDQGLSTLGLKPLAAGAEETADGPQNEDARLLMQYTTLDMGYSQINPVLLPEPMAPHIAAARAGKRLSLDRLRGYVSGALTARPDFCLLEGAGGWRVPLTPTQTLADLPKSLELPVILVVGMKLGCLNHALLTAEAIARDGLKLAAWVATQVDPDMAVVEENLNTLKHLLPCPCLGYIPWLDQANAESASAHLQLTPLGI